MNAVIIMINMLVFSLSSIPRSLSLFLSFLHRPLSPSPFLSLPLSLPPSPLSPSLPSLSPSLYLSFPHRPGNLALTEFIFNTEMNVGRQILTSWSMALMENVDPQKLNLISNYILSTQGNGGGKEASKSSSLSKNFFGTLKQKGSQSNIKDDKGMCLCECTVVQVHVHVCTVCVYCLLQYKCSVHVCIVY